MDQLEDVSLLLIYCSSNISLLSTIVTLFVNYSMKLSVFKLQFIREDEFPQRQPPLWLSLEEALTESV